MSLARFSAEEEEVGQEVGERFELEEGGVVVSTSIWSISASKSGARGKQHSHNNDGKL